MLLHVLEETMFLNTILEAIYKKSKEIPHFLSLHMAFEQSNDFVYIFGSIIQYFASNFQQLERRYF